MDGAAPRLELRSAASGITGHTWGGLPGRHCPESRAGCPRHNRNRGQDARATLSGKRPAGRRRLGADEADRRVQLDRDARSPRNVDVAAAPQQADQRTDTRADSGADSHALPVTARDGAHRGPGGASSRGVHADFGSLAAFALQGAVFPLGVGSVPLRRLHHRLHLPGRAVGQDDSVEQQLQLGLPLDAPRLLAQVDDAQHEASRGNDDLVVQRDGDFHLGVEAVAVAGHGRVDAALHDHVDLGLGRQHCIVDGLGQGRADRQQRQDNTHAKEPHAPIDALYGGQVQVQC